MFFIGKCHVRNPCQTEISLHLQGVTTQACWVLALIGILNLITSINRISLYATTARAVAVATGQLEVTSTVALTAQANEHMYLPPNVRAKNNQIDRWHLTNQLPFMCNNQNSIVHMHSTVNLSGSNQYYIIYNI